MAQPLSDLTLPDEAASGQADGLARPFLKWVGGKRSILPILKDRLPPRFTTYHEPFVGGGALFFAVQPRAAALTDVNRHLILAYKAIRDDVDRLIRILRHHKKNHNRAHFMKARRWLSEEKEGTVIASLLIYLNKTCFNGLYRVNRAGEYNVPIGDYREPCILDEETLRADSRALQGVEVDCRDFTKVRPERGAFYYLDPPYHETYDGYTGRGFGDDEHRELARLCDRIDAAGGYFMLSNSDTALVRKFYDGRYRIERVSASRSVSCKARQRGKEDELLIRNYP